MASINFINECKNRANGNRLGKITVNGFENSITNSDSLQSFSIDSGCYVNGNIIGSVYAKCLKANFVSDIANLSDKNIDVQTGVKYADLSNEYINMGKYTVERPNNEITANMSQIIAYDSLYAKLDDKYVCGIDYSSEDKTLKDLYIDVCNQLGLTPKTTDILNGNIAISDNPFTNGEKNRTVLQTVAKIACSFVDIDNDTNEIDLCWLSQNEEPDYIFYKKDYVSVDGGQVVCGPINCLIIKNSQIDSENVTIKDEESIALYGEHSIIISEDYILHNAELREQAITTIWNHVKGMKYVDCKLTTYYGKPFLKLGDRIRVYTSEEEYFDTYALKHQFTYDGTFASVIDGPALTEQEIKTQQDIGLKEALYNTQIDVNKQKKQITSLVEETTENSNKIVKVTQDINNIQNLFQITGGNNLIKNSVGLFGNEYWSQSEEGTFTFGEDSNLIGKTTSASKITISKGTLTSLATNIGGLTLDTVKSFNFKIRQDEDVTTTVTLWGMSESSPLYKKTFTGKVDLEDIYNEEECRFFVDNPNLTLKIQSSSIYNGKVEISDLMLNDGEKQQWQPSIGEVWGTVIRMTQLGISCYSIEGGFVTMMATQGFQIRELHGSTIGNVITDLTRFGITTTDIFQTGKYKQKNLVRDVIETDGYDHYPEYIEG